MTSSFFVLAYVHANGVAIDHHRALVRGIRRAYRDALGGRPRVRVLWIDMPPGSAFVAGKPSTLSSLLASVPESITEPTRQALMRGICETWMQTTGCPVDDVMVTAPERSMAKAYLQAGRARFDPRRVRGVALRLGLRVAARRVMTGRAAVHTDLS